MNKSFENLGGGKYNITCDCGTIHTVHLLAHHYCESYGLGEVPDGVELIWQVHCPYCQDRLFLGTPSNVIEILEEN